MAVWHKDGAVEELLKLRRDGFSAGRIADMLTMKFNVNVTRNAVLGKLDRMGLGGLIKTTASLRGSKRKRNPTPWGGRTAFQRVSKPKPKKLVQALLEMAPQPLPDRQPADIARMSFAERDPKLHCAFIPGDPQEGDALTSKKYCGLPIARGSPAPYCLEHLRRCFQILPEAKPRPSFANDNARAPVRETEKV